MHPDLQPLNPAVGSAKSPVEHWATQTEFSSYKSGSVGQRVTQVLELLSEIFPTLTQFGSHLRVAVLANEFKHDATHMLVVVSAKSTEQPLTQSLPSA